MLTTFHIMDSAEHETLKHLYSQSHYVVLSGSQILVSITFKSQSAAGIFMKSAKTASHLPHPIYNSGSLITDAQAQNVSQCPDLFPECSTPAERLAAAQKCNTGNIAQRAGALHNLMKLSCFC